MTLPIATFLMALTAVLATYWLFVLRPERRAEDALRRRLKVGGPVRDAKTRLLRRARALSAVPSLNAALQRTHARLRPVERLIEQSGVRLTVGAFLAASGLAVLLAFYVVNRATAVPSLSLLVGALAGSLPTAVLRYKRSRRVAKFEEQFPEALDLLSRALKAGHAFTTGLAMIAEEMPVPLGPEFRLLYEQQNYGMPMPDALKAFAGRVPLLDARFFVTAVLIQRDAGGNLSEVLDNLASVIRDRFRVKRQIRVISAHGRLTGLVLTAIPPCLALVLFLINPEHWKTLTGTDLGIRMILAAIVLQVSGGLMIRRLIRIEY